MQFDTDVLIWFLRGNKKASTVLESAPQRHLSIITYMELLQGARDKQETRVIKAFLSDAAFLTLPLTENIGHRASIYMEEYALKVDMCIADALIAATAVENGLTLCSANRKHYKPVNELELKTFRP